MLFNSLEFLIFFPVVTILFYVLPHKYRWALLLLASCIFYMAFIPQYILILFTTIVIDYVAGIMIENTDAKKKKTYLVVSIISTCLVLFIFKYFDFFNENMLYLSQKFNFHYPENTIKFILPIGLSFHTFQSLSYVIEVYRGRQKAEKHFGIYSLYVMFYPQLVTGPIERPQNLLVQLRQIKKFEYSNLVDGLRLIIFGLFTKMVIADNIAIYVDQVYDNPGGFNSVSIITALILYSFQIYCDFYGYSTIAIGCAKAMGYRLMDNFNNPYISQSIGEFWQRWHISLSTWFRDYVYFSLGGNRVKIQRWAINILIVFGLSGLWHGANWTFLIWGLAHGILYVVENLANRVIKIDKNGNKTFNCIIKGFNIAKTFTFVTLIWILFRATNLAHVKQVFTSLFNNWNVADDFRVEPKIWLLFGLFILVDLILVNSRFDYWINKRPVFVRWSLYTALIFVVLVFSSIENFPFIYFQF